MRVLKWTIRILSVLSIAIMLMFLVGERGMNEGNPPTAGEWLGICFFPIGVVVGMGLGWWHEFRGGIFGVVSLFLFYVWDAIRSGTPPNGIWFAVFSLPAFLFLIYGCWQQRIRTGRFSERM